MSFARHGRCKQQSFPRKRESSRQTFGNALSTDWIPPAERDGNDRHFERDPIPNDTTARQDGTLQNQTVRCILIVTRGSKMGV